MLGLPLRARPHASSTDEDAKASRKRYANTKRNAETDFDACGIG